MPDDGLPGVGIDRTYPSIDQGSVWDSILLRHGVTTGRAWGRRALTGQTGRRSRWRNEARTHADRYDLGGDGNTTKPVSRDVHLTRRSVYAKMDLGIYEAQETTSPRTPSPFKPARPVPRFRL